MMNLTNMRSQSFHFLRVTLIISLCFADLTELWNTEQLTDMILTDAYGTNAPGLMPAVIALYETPCKDILYKQIGFTDRNFPRGLHLQFAVFDRLKAKTTPWYFWDPKIMDLFYYYNITTANKTDFNQWCPTILYQPANFSLPITIYHEEKDGKFEDWVWRMLNIPKIEFTNTFENENDTITLLFKFKNEGSNTESDIINEQIVAIVPPKSTVNVENLHVGDILVAMNAKGETVNRYILNQIETKIEITQSRDDSILNDNKFLEKLDNDYNLLLRRNWSTRRRHLNNIKSPPLMPKFTAMGFKHTRAPKEICDYVTQFYNENKDRKQLESFPIDGTQINAREIPTYMMHIPGNKKKWIADIMQPILSEWAGVPLTYSTMYGLREYVNGAVLKGHIDRIETHIISTIIHVTHEPHNVSWPLEVVSWDGKRYYINDTDCDMVFYESSKLIHGRPFSYQGNSWINAFLHFRPSDWKGYTFTPQNVVKTPNAEVPLVDFVYG